MIILLLARCPHDAELHARTGENAMTSGYYEAATEMDDLLGKVSQDKQVGRLSIPQLLQRWALQQLQE